MSYHRTLQDQNEQIEKYINELKTQHDDLLTIISKQENERVEIEKELERLNYKLVLVKKGLSQRIQIKNNYEKAIDDLEKKYIQLVEISNNLLLAAQTEFSDLDQMMDKQTNVNEAILLSINKKEVPEKLYN